MYGFGKRFLDSLNDSKLCSTTFVFYIYIYMLYRMWIFLNKLTLKSPPIVMDEDHRGRVCSGSKAKAAKMFFFQTESCTSCCEIPRCSQNCGMMWMMQYSVFSGSPRISILCWSFSECYTPKVRHLLSSPRD